MRSAELCSGGALLLLVALSQTLAVKDPPTVNVYTQAPVEYGVKNTLICHSDGFHPPLITMQLRKNKVEILNCENTAPSFKQDWKYYKTTYTSFIPEKDATYDCVVTHDNGTPQTYQLEIF